MQTNFLEGENTHGTEPMQDPAHPPYGDDSVSSFILLFVNVYVCSRALPDRVDVTPSSANNSGNHS